MKTPLIIFSVWFALLLQTSTLFADAKNGAVLLQADNFEHIEFSRIKSSRYSFHDQRDSDDAVFKIGLLLSGEESFFNPFLPSWMKRVEESLQHPSDNMVYLLVKAKHASGEQWINPYNKRISMIAMNSVAGDKDWHTSNYTFENPVNVVAVWLMADGDNTDSRFTVNIKSLSLE